MARKKILPGRFELMEGKHHESIPTGKVNEIGVPEKIRKTYRRGDEVVSHHDLEKRYNGPTGRKQKFRYLGAATPEEVKASKSLPAPPPDQEAEELRQIEDLDSMRLDELKFLASQEDIDITGLTRKQDILTRIRQHRDSTVETVEVSDAD